MELCAGGELYDRWADKGREDGVKQDEQQQALASYFSDGASDQRYASSRAQKHGLWVLLEDTSTRTKPRPRLGKLGGLTPSVYEP